MDAKKRQRCLGALHRRKLDMLHWEKILGQVQQFEGSTQQEGIKRKLETAKNEIEILRSKLGVS